MTDRARRIPKPEWLKIKLGDSARFGETRRILDTHGLHTICTSGRCPNQGECWSRGTASLMIAGDICTRSCKFCNTRTGIPQPLDVKEPENVAESIKLMHLSHVVITSVTRDDLPDFGAAHWAETIRKVKEINPGVTVEVLIPDFQGRTDCINEVLEARPDVLSHNLETVKRLTPLVRSRAKYDLSLDVLKYAAEMGIHTKSGLMLGLGESEEEIYETMEDLLAAGCYIFTMGQYLQPSKRHLPVQSYVHPDQFRFYKMAALEKGFRKVESAPLVRSSYHAERHVL